MKKNRSKRKKTSRPDMTERNDGFNTKPLTLSEIHTGVDCARIQRSWPCKNLVARVHTVLDPHENL